MSEALSLKTGVGQSVRGSLTKAWSGSECQRLSLKHGVGQHTAMHAAPTDRKFFHTDFGLPVLFNFICSKSSSHFPHVSCMTGHTHTHTHKSSLSFRARVCTVLPKDRCIHATYGSGELWLAIRAVCRPRQINCGWLPTVETPCIKFTAASKAFMSTGRLEGAFRRGRE